MPKLTSSKFKTGKREKPITPTITSVSPNPFTGEVNTNFEIEGTDFPQDAVPYFVNGSGTEYALPVILRDTILPSSQYTLPGTYTWICPSGVTSVSVVAIGAGGAGSNTSPWGEVGNGGGGGGLAWKNNIPVVPGQSYTVVVGAGGGGNGGDSYFIDTSTVRGHGGTARNSGGGLGGSYTVSGTSGGGAAGGNGSGSLTSGANGQRAGGGSGGYSGSGGAGSNTGTAGTGGAGGGGSQDRGGGGVRPYGQGTSGAAGGAGGSYGSAGEALSQWGVGGTGGTFGGGGGGGVQGNGNWGERGGYGAGGAVRLVWGTQNVFPTLPDTPAQKGFRVYTTRNWLVSEAPLTVRVKSATKTINSSFQVTPGNAPVWQTVSGNLGTWLYTQQNFSYTLVATDADVNTVLTYSITTGSLPPGLSLNSSTGLISGGSAYITSDTTYTFTVRVSDQVGNTADRSFNIIKQGSAPINVEYLVVAGGGAGGSDVYQDRSAGGGGAGGYRTGTLSTAVGTSYTITVGGGGAGASGTVGGKGSDSVFGTITSTGGGGGAGHTSSGNVAAGSGGSGGGSTHDNAFGPAGAGNTPAVSPSQGNSGGGAGSPQGGIGAQSSITGVATYYAGGGSASASSGWCGGGGGGAGAAGGGGSFVGGNGGGGNSGQSDGVVTGSAGTANRGGGGGGSRETTGGNGGSGIVILRVPSSITVSFGGGLSTSLNTSVSGFKIYTITGGSSSVSFGYW